MKTQAILPAQYQCTGKASFRSYRKAITAAKRLRERVGDLLVAYPCPHCHLFHVGNKSADEPEKDYKRRRRQLAEVE